MADEGKQLLCGTAAQLFGIKRDRRDLWRTPLQRFVVIQGGKTDILRHAQVQLLCALQGQPVETRMELGYQVSLRESTQT